MLWEKGIAGHSKLLQLGRWLDPRDLVWYCMRRHCSWCGTKAMLCKVVILDQIESGKWRLVFVGLASDGVEEQLTK